MKRIGLLLLAVAVLTGLSGCTEDDDTLAIIGIDASCTGKFYAAVGKVSAVESAWISGEFSIHPSGKLTITLPRGGTYRITFYEESPHWDYTTYFPEGKTTEQIFTCR
jgi:hypothetical protein